MAAVMPRHPERAPHSGAPCETESAFAVAALKRQVIELFLLVSAGELVLTPNVVKFFTGTRSAWMMGCADASTLIVSLTSVRFVAADLQAFRRMIARHNKVRDLYAPRASSTKTFQRRQDAAWNDKVVELAGRAVTVA